MTQEALFGETTGDARILTVKRPWAWGLIFGGKDIENRKQYAGYRGLLLIHAGQAADEAGIEFMRSLGIEPPAEAFQGAGCIIGSVQVTGCVSGSRSRWAKPGMWHIQVSDPRPATRLVTARGNLGLQMPPAGWEHAFGTNRSY